MLPPAHVLPFDTTTTDIQLLTGAFILRGWTFIETTGTAAAILNLIDGASTTKPLITPIALTAGQSTRDWLTGNGIIVRTGVLLDIVSGSVRGAIWFTPLTHADDIEIAFGEWAPVLVRPGA